MQHEAKPANRAALDWLNFLLADVTGGAGPFLAIYLMSSQQWEPGRIGIVLTVGGIATVLARGPAGALVDGVRWKRTLVAASCLIVAIAVAITALAPHRWPVTIAQAAAGLADAVFPSAIAAISLGTFGRVMFTPRIGRNEAFNHLGNAASAIVAGLAGYRIAPVAVLWVVVVLAAASIIAAYRIDGSAIDHTLARGADDGNAKTKSNSIAILLENRPLLLFTASITLFHFANAAMLPLLGEKLSQGRQQPVHGCLHHHRTGCDGADGIAGRSQGGCLGPQAALPRGLRRAANSWAALHRHAGSVRARVDPGARRHWRRHLRCNCSLSSLRISPRAPATTISHSAPAEPAGDSVPR